MTQLENVLAANRRFAGTDARDHTPQIPFIPNRQLYVLTCVDPRVDPADTLGLALGDAVVARNVGGRVNTSFLDDLAWICYLHETKTPDADWFDVAIIHHTDCGSALMADDETRRGFVQRGFNDDQLRATAVVDPAMTVAADVEALLASGVGPGSLLASGFVYDVETGLLSQVVNSSGRADTVA